MHTFQFAGNLLCAQLCCAAVAALLLHASYLTLLGFMSDKSFRVAELHRITCLKYLHIH